MNDMTETVHGYIELGDTIDITDPGYDENVWCRVNNFPIEPGEYECYTQTLDNKETDGWGDRISRIGIRKTGYEVDHCERKAMIGVDSGLAGFFNCDNRIPFEQVLNERASASDVYISNDYFFSSSGYGDGGYDVYVGYSEGVIADVYIEFIRNRL